LERLPAFIPLDTTLAHYVCFLHQQLLQGVGSRSSERQMLLLLIQLLQERFGESLRLDRRVDAARAYLDQHFHQTVSLSQLARVANLSPRHLSDLFRRQLGMTPLQYLTEKRMQRAWQLLEVGELNVQQVADRVGYSNLAAFSDRFRKHFGQSPRYFRQIAK
jgi:AraC-like DNA-binding protein